MTEPQVTVRVAEQDDVEAIALLRTMAAEADHDSELLGRMLTWWEGEGDRRTTWLAEADGRLVGMASLFEYRRMPAPGRPDARWGYVGNVQVRADARDEGVGGQLLSALVSAATARGYERLVLAPSPRSLPFYERAGFELAGAEAGAPLMSLQL